MKPRDSDVRKSKAAAAEASEDHDPGTGVSGREGESRTAPSAFSDRQADSNSSERTAPTEGGWEPVVRQRIRSGPEVRQTGVKKRDSSSGWEVIRIVGRGISWEERGGGSVVLCGDRRDARQEG